MANFAMIKSVLKKKNLEYAELCLRVLAFLAGGYWTFYIFKYQYEILPETEPTSLILKSSIKRVGILDSLDFYQIEVTIHNRSKSRIQIPASYYNIVGGNIKQIVNPAKRFSPGLLKSPDSLYFNNFYSTDTSKSILIQTDRILNDNSYISPDSEFNVQHSFAIPKKKFELLFVTISSISSKKDANVYIKWHFDKFGCITAFPHIVKSSLIGKNDTIPYSSLKDVTFAAENDLYFTNISNDYFLTR